MNWRKLWQHFRNMACGLTACPFMSNGRSYAEEARRNELKHGLQVLASGESRAGAQRFTSGEGKHGFKDKPEG